MIEAGPVFNSLLVGLSIAGAWFVAALGLAIIYGTMKVINMAHGEFMMLGAYATYFLQTTIGLPYMLCLPAAFMVVAAFGYLVERGFISYLYERPLDTLLATVGLSFVLIQAVRLTFGGGQQRVATPDWINFYISLGPFSMSGPRLFMIVTAILLFLAVLLIYKKTHFGLMLRSVTQNNEMAEACGMPSRRIYGLAFALGSGLAGVGGALFMIRLPASPDMGSGFIVEAFVTVVLGGGSLVGTFLSALMLGELQGVLSYFTSQTIAVFLLFVFVVIFLRFRPQGLISEGAGRR